MTQFALASDGYIRLIDDLLPNDRTVSGVI